MEKDDACDTGLRQPRAIVSHRLAPFGGIWRDNVRQLSDAQLLARILARQLIVLKIIFERHKGLHSRSRIWTATGSVRIELRY